MSERKRVTVRFRFNQATGQIEEFLIDDDEPTAPEAYHDRIARAIAGQIFRRPRVIDSAVDIGVDGEAPRPTSEPSQPAPEAAQTPPQREHNR
jgi:hypothetical protein